MAQYFDNNPSLKSNIRHLEVYLNDEKLSFISDAGVFSNRQIDFGSYLLVKSILTNNKVDKLCDLGCGYGFIGIACKYFDKANEVTFIDVNKQACLLTEKNIESYHLANCQVYCNDGFKDLDLTFDSIIFNPPIRAGKLVIYRLFKEAYERLNVDGCLYIVIKKDLGANSAYKELESYYKNVTIVNKQKGYFIIEAKK